MPTRVLRTRNPNLNYHIPDPDTSNSNILDLLELSKPNNTKMSARPASSKPPPSEWVPDQPQASITQTKRKRTSQDPSQPPPEVTASSFSSKKVKSTTKAKRSAIMKNHSPAPNILPLSKPSSELQAILPPVPAFQPITHSSPEHAGHHLLPRSITNFEKIEPIHIWDLFWPCDFISLLANNTNLYAEKKRAELGDGGRDWTPVTAGDIYIWIGIQIHMGLLGLSPSIYWNHDDLLLPKDGLPTVHFMSQTRFEQIKRYLHISPASSSSKSITPTQPWYHKVEPLLTQMKKAAQAYWLPSSNTTFDEAMILFTGRSVHITKMPNKPIGLGYKVFCLADHGYIYDFHLSSNARGLDSISEEAKTITNLTLLVRWYSP